MTSTEITAHTILPAQREDIELKTADGLTLLGELAMPPAGRPPVATLVTLHPLPTHAGMMDSHVYRKAAWRLPALADLAVLRFNTRGTTSARGTSEGTFGEGVDERHDVAAAIDFVDHRGLPNPWLVGWSFGTELTMRYGCEPQIVGAILLSPPLHRATDADIRTWAASGKPVKILVPELDDYLRPEEALHRFAALFEAGSVGLAEGAAAGVGVAGAVAARTAGSAAPESAASASPSSTGPAAPTPAASTSPSGSAALSAPNSHISPAAPPVAASPLPTGSAAAQSPAPNTDPAAGAASAWPTASAATRHLPSTASAPSQASPTAAVAASVTLAGTTPNGSELIAVPGAKHLWVGEKYVKIVLNAIVHATNPSAAPLPAEYDGRFGPATKYGA